MGFKMKGFSGFTDEKYSISKSSIDGLGAIASKNIKKGELIGTAFDNEEAINFDRNPDKTHNDTRTILGKYLNHQDSENSIQKSENNSLNVYANKDIKKGEEITINYNKAPDYVKAAANTGDYKEI
tara:strand:- start:1741 stop:2118 length:378 start_codon:yes stop_codon:yes gene_type:complete